MLSPSGTTEEDDAENEKRQENCPSDNAACNDSIADVT